MKKNLFANDCLPWRSNSFGIELVSALEGVISKFWHVIVYLLLITLMTLLKCAFPTPLGRR